MKDISVQTLRGECIVVEGEISSVSEGFIRRKGLAIGHAWYTSVECNPDLNNGLQQVKRELLLF